MHRTRTTGALLALLLTAVLPVAGQGLAKPASSLTAAGSERPEPAGVKGYVTWTDPASGKKHLVTGMAEYGGVWNKPVRADNGPVFLLRFKGVSAGDLTQVLADYTSDAYMLDAAGRQQIYLRYTASPSANRGEGFRGNLPTPPAPQPAAFRYDIRFIHDLSYVGQPLQEPRIVHLGDEGNPNSTNFIIHIRYNPTRHHFLDIAVKTPSFQSSTIAVDLNDFLTRPPSQPQRPTPFTDLPAF